MDDEVNTHFKNSLEMNLDSPDTNALMGLAMR